MTTESFPIRAESLLQHREFVRALARSLVRDEHAAQDVVQETWLEALRHPPRAASALPGWLARVVRSRAQNVARGESRRVARERSVAREEVDESEEKLRERVAMQHKVVEAVLALKEPYRTVVLLHYYEGLSPSQIAARRNVPAGSVRAQLSRAHDLLRERLDAEFGGSRAAWAVGLAALARGRGGLALGAKLAAAGVVAAAAAVPVILWATRPAHAPAAELAALEPIATTPGATPIVPPGPDPVPTSLSSSRSAMPAASALEQIHSTEELESMSVRTLLQIAIHVQQAVRSKLLTPADELKRTYAPLLALSDTGLARLLGQSRFGSFESNALGMRGGGSCISFATRKQRWDDEPDLYWDDRDGSFRSMGWGPGILDLGEQQLENLPTSASPMLPGLREKQVTAWELYWADGGMTETEVSPEYRQRCQVLGLGPPKVQVGHAYLVRGMTPGAHDLLAAFTPISRDEMGWTIAWRVLHTWPVAHTRGEVNDPYWVFPDPPAALADQSVEALVDLLARIRSVAHAKLYAVPPGLKDRYSARLASEGTGIARLLNGDRYGPLIEKRGGGSFFSFATGENDYDREPDLMLDQSSYRARFYGGDMGWILDLGTTPIETAGTSAAASPKDLDANGSESWRFLWTLHALGHDQWERAISEADEETSHRLGLNNQVGVKIDGTYLLRNISPGEHDVLALFTTAASDEYGSWIVYRVIRNRKLVKEPERR